MNEVRLIWIVQSMIHKYKCKLLELLRVKDFHVHAVQKLIKDLVDEWWENNSVSKFTNVKQ